MGNFFDCVRSRALPICDVETGHRSATMCHLGAISLRTGHRFTWNPEQEKFTGEHASLGNGYLAREMRMPYDYSMVSEVVILHSLGAKRIYARGGKGAGWPLILGNPVPGIRRSLQ